MSSLQLALIVAGVLLVIAVVIFNGWQERKLRRSLGKSHVPPERADASAVARSTRRVEPTLGAQDGAASADAMPVFRGGEPRDAGLEPAPGGGEPQDVASDGSNSFSAAADVAHSALPAPAASLAAARVPSSPSAPARIGPAQPDHEIECLIPLQPEAPIGAGSLAAGLHARIGKALRWFGRADARSDWARLTSDTPGRFSEVVACMLLADRNGAASRAQLDAFVRIVDEIALTLPAELTPPDIPRELARAESLDRLCAELDVQIGLTLQMPGAASIAGTRLRGVAEASGFRLSTGGRFEHLHEETGAVLYTLQNLRPDPFSAEMLRLTATNGVVFLLDVARIADPARGFDQMKLAARRMAVTLGADLVDDNKRPLDDAALAVIREQVETAADALRAVHIEPGSPRALALFSA